MAVAAEGGRVRMGMAVKEGGAAWYTGWWITCGPMANGTPAAAAPSGSKLACKKWAIVKRVSCKINKEH